MTSPFLPFLMFTAQKIYCLRSGDKTALAASACSFCRLKQVNTINPGNASKNYFSIFPPADYF